ncbi:MAG: hypothetical protein EOM17_14560 [Synergistales bacterium]|nr:hypothetical protein [Synergistales bacterium]
MDNHIMREKFRKVLDETKSLPKREVQRALVKAAVEALREEPVFKEAGVFQDEPEDISNKDKRYNQRFKRFIQRSRARQNSVQGRVSKNSIGNIVSFLYNSKYIAQRRWKLCFSRFIMTSRTSSRARSRRSPVRSASKSGDDGGGEDSDGSDPEPPRLKYHPLAALSLEGRRAA